MNIAIPFRPKLFEPLKIIPASFSDPLHQERQKLDAVRREPAGALERANGVMQAPVSGSRALSQVAQVTTLTGGNGKPNS